MKDILNREIKQGDIIYVFKKYNRNPPYFCLVLEIDSTEELLLKSQYGNIFKTNNYDYEILIIDDHQLLINKGIFKSKNPKILEI